MLSDQQVVEMKLEEYKMLRTEMNYEMQAQDSLINICLTSVTAVITFAFSQHMSMILLATYPILYFLLVRFLRHRERIMHISGYQIVFLEPYIGFHWETIGNKAHIEQINLKNYFWHVAHYHFWGVLAILNLCASLFIDYLYPPTSLYSTVIQYFVHVVAIILIYKVSFSLALASKVRAQKVQYWEQMKEKFLEKETTLNR